MFEKKRHREREGVWTVKFIDWSSRPIWKPGSITNVDAGRLQSNYRVPTVVQVGIKSALEVKVRRSKAVVAGDKVWVGTPPPLTLLNPAVTPLQGSLQQST